MPWCPNCKTEYQTGVTMCSDCKAELVDDIKEAVALVPFFQAEDKKVAEKLVKFFHYSELESSLGYDEENDLYIVLVDPKKQQEAKKLYQAFYFVERQLMEKGKSDVFVADSNEKAEESQKSEETLDNSEADAEEASDWSEADNAEEASDNSEADTDEPSEIDGEEAENYSLESEDDVTKEDESQDETPGDEINAFDDEDDDNSSYIMKVDQYKDLAGTVWIFLITGVAGLIFVLLNVLGVLSIFSGWIAFTVMGALFLFFIYVAISTNQKAKTVQTEIDAEIKLTEEINEWLAKNITSEFLSSISDKNFSNELNYLKQTDIIKEMLIKQFGNQNLAYLDRLIEEYYNKNFDNITE